MNAASDQGLLHRQVRYSPCLAEWGPRVVPAEYALRGGSVLTSSSAQGGLFGAEEALEFAGKVGMF